MRYLGNTRSRQASVLSATVGLRLESASPPSRATQLFEAETENFLPAKFQFSNFEIRLQRIIFGLKLAI